MGNIREVFEYGNTGLQPSMYLGGVSGQAVISAQFDQGEKEWSQCGYLDIKLVANFDANAPATGNVYIVPGGGIDGSFTDAGIPTTGNQNLSVGKLVTATYGSTLYLGDVRTPPGNTTGMRQFVAGPGGASAIGSAGQQTIVWVPGRWFSVVVVAAAGAAPLAATGSQVTWMPARPLHKI